MAGRILYMLCKYFEWVHCLVVSQAPKQQSCGAAHPLLLSGLKTWWPLKCNCFNGRKGEGSLKDWLRDLVSRWTNQRGSQGHSQGPRQTNIPVSSLSHPWTPAHLHSKKQKHSSSHLTPHCVFSQEHFFLICPQSCTLPQGWNCI